ncbi:MAG: hypothetical protein BGO05_29500 [Rhizobiales bacterium 63-7]|nr:MAG: hypothetical protein BGO05_29500 [Rhizobiales bacterium 63-7]
MRDRSNDVRLPLILPVPVWTNPRAAAEREEDAAFAAGAALFGLDAFLRSEPAFAGCWRQRLALANAAAAVRLLGRREDEAALRDAIHLSGPEADPGPAGRVALAFRKLAGPAPPVQSAVILEIAGLLDIRLDADLEAIPALFDDILQQGRAAPFAAAGIITEIHRLRPDAELLGWWLADRMLAAAMGWSRAVPLMMTARSAAAFRTGSGRGRLFPADAGFSKAVCLVVASAVQDALRLAADLDRKTGRLIEAARKVRTKGAEPVLDRLLDDDSVPASAPGTTLSRWASRRFFERLEEFGAVRELSGRTTFRIYGL